MGITLEKEWRHLLEREERYLRGAEAKKGGMLQEVTGKIENKLPQRLISVLHTAFYKAFFTIFEKGTPVIEKTFKGEELALEFQVNDFRIEKKPTKKSLRKLESAAVRSRRLNSCFATAEGLGLGILGIGLPDIPLFLGVLLKGIYETAASYGYHYRSEEEQVLILRMIVAALAKGTEKRWADQKVEEWIASIGTERIYSFEEEVKKAAVALSDEMLAAKFIQTIPLVGVVGGVGNPFVYRKILYYAAMKYKKRYLMEKRRNV